MYLAGIFEFFEVVRNWFRKKKKPQKLERHKRTGWGEWEILADKALSDRTNMRVKILRVNPGKNLSLQWHKERDEHWVVLSGKGLYMTYEVHDDGATDKVIRQLWEDDHVVIKRNVIHQIYNNYDEPLVIAELQIGNPDENDILRIKHELDSSFTDE